MIVERTDKSITLYPNINKDNTEITKSQKRISLSIEKSENKAVLIQRGFSGAGRAKLAVKLTKDELKDYIQELEQIYAELDNRKLNTIR